MGVKRCGLTLPVAIAAMLIIGACEGERNSTPHEYGQRTPQQTRGAALFEQHCSHCHGEQGSGGRMTKPLKRRRFNFGGGKEDIMTTIRHGRPQGMPAFNGSLDDKQIEALASYVLWLQ